jgi:hypothetical protein
VRGQLGREAFLALLATLGALVLVNVPELGSDAWPFAEGDVDPQGVLGPVVRAAGEHWDRGSGDRGGMACPDVADVGSRHARRRRALAPSRSGGAAPGRTAGCD